MAQVLASFTLMICYSKLAKICYKDRNRLLSENLELAYLLSCVNIRADNALFEKANILQN